jgi:hypothetical protein
MDREDLFDSSVLYAESILAHFGQVETCFPEAWPDARPSPRLAILSLQSTATSTEVEVAISVRSVGVAYGVLLRQPGATAWTSLEACALGGLGLEGPLDLPSDGRSRLEVESGLRTLVGVVHQCLEDIERDADRFWDALQAWWQVRVAEGRAMQRERASLHAYRALLNGHDEAVVHWLAPYRDELEAKHLRRLTEAEARLDSRGEGREE